MDYYGKMGGYCGVQSGRVLPTAYQNVMSYEQQVRMLICDLFEMKDRLEKIENEFYTLNETITDNAQKDALKVVKEEFKKLSAVMLEQYEAMLQEIYAQNDEHYNAQLGQFAEFQAMNMRMLKDIQSRVMVIKNHVDALSLNWQNALSSIIKQNIQWQTEAEDSLSAKIESKNGKDISVLSPVDGLYKNLNSVITDIYNLVMKSAGLTVMDFQKLNITVDSWEHMYVTVDSFMYNAKYALRDELERKPYYAYVDKEVGRLRNEMIADYNRLEGMLYVTNAFTGENQPLTQAIAFLFNLHQERGITTDGFARIEERVDAFAERKIQAYTFAIQGIM